MGLLNSVIDSFRFKDIVFYKQDSELQKKYDALVKLNKEYPNNKELKSKLNIVKKGLEGENEIAYQLKKSNIGMYVLRDVTLKYEDLKAQIDYIVITPVYTYYIECKNLIGNITVNEKGDFIREFEFDGKMVKKGLYSPLRQVEAQREVIRKIWENRSSKLTKLLGSKSFNHYRRVLVVASNRDTIINTSKAPNSIKYKIIKSDALIRQIEYEFNHRDEDESLLYNQKEFEEIAKNYLDLAITNNIDYYECYKNKYCSNSLRDRLLEFRKKRSSEMSIPPYYVFNNDELDKIVELKPSTIIELNNILSDIKVKTHGKEIINIVNG